MTVSQLTSPTPAGNKTHARGGVRQWFRKYAAAYAFVLPALLTYAVFVLYPFLITIYYSMTDWDGAQPQKNFIGLANYQRMLGDPLMWLSLQHNLIWIAVGTITPVALGLGLATLVWSGVRGRLFFRTVYFMPVVLSTVVVGMIWSWIYHPIFGPINLVLRAIGLDSVARGWLGDLTWAIYALLLAGLWAYFGFCFVILLAALQNIDMELHDAAKIDGANAWQRFINVTIPQLSAVLTMLLAYTLIGGFNVFDIVYIMTKGGPANATEVLTTYTYTMAFKQSQVGYGAALTMVITILSLIASYLFISLRERSSAES
ncbi:MAG: sugar ABC transporter permease [Caldilineaceae bacterium]